MNVTKDFLKSSNIPFKLLNCIWSTFDIITAFLNLNNEIVGYISINRGEITAFEINQKYQGYGLSKQILDYAVKVLNANKLFVAIENEISYNLYLQYGFKEKENSVDIFKDDKGLIYYIEMNK